MKKLEHILKLHLKEFYTVQCNDLCFQFAFRILRVGNLDLQARYLDREYWWIASAPLRKERDQKEAGKQKQKEKTTEERK
jgi:hypothetical protein